MAAPALRSRGSEKPNSWTLGRPTESISLPPSTVLSQPRTSRFYRSTRTNLRRLPRPYIRSHNISDKVQDTYDVPRQSPMETKRYNNENKNNGNKLEASLGQSTLANPQTFDIVGKRQQCSHSNHQRLGCARLYPIDRTRPARTNVSSTYSRQRSLSANSVGSGEMDLSTKAIRLRWNGCIDLNGVIPVSATPRKKRQRPFMEESFLPPRKARCRQRKPFQSSSTIEKVESSPHVPNPGMQTSLTEAIPPNTEVTLLTLMMGVSTGIVRHPGLPRAEVSAEIIRYRETMLLEYWNTPSTIPLNRS